MARRGRAAVTFAEAFVRVAAAIMLETIAFAVWDVGTRSPVRLIADVRAGVRQPVSFRRGCFRFLVGIIALSGAAILTAPAVPRSGQWALLLALTLIAALLVEQLIGPDLRTRRYR
ncbi:MAG: hypothetical protein ABR591_06055 [Candidatus Velthaea sp.]